MNEELKDALENFIAMLKKENMFRENNLTAFQKTERLLYKYNDFQDAIAAKEEQISELNEWGLKHQSKSITKYGAGSGEVKTEQERLDDKIESLENMIEDTRRYVRIIDKALERIKTDEFFPIIRMKYFDDLTQDDIGSRLHVDGSTISRNKNRLIRKLAVYLFPDESLTEIMQ